MTSSNIYKVLFPILSVAETVVFLILPWSFLIQTDDSWASRIFASHLYHIQTQIALEPFLREGYRIQHYWFILGTTALRGLGIATWAVRYYTEVRRDTSTVNFLDAYTKLAILVWLAANVIIVFVWHPCLKRKNPYKDSIVIITGAASGIGSAIAEEIVNRGAKAVVLVAESLDRRTGF
jgi:3-oxoacyl-ACP reductase-like protein